MLRADCEYLELKPVKQLLQLNAVFVHASFILGGHGQMLGTSTHLAMCEILCTCNDQLMIYSKRSSIFDLLMVTIFYQ